MLKWESQKRSLDSWSEKIITFDRYEIGCELFTSETNTALGHLDPFPQWYL